MSGHQTYNWFVHGLTITMLNITSGLDSVSRYNNDKRGNQIDLYYYNVNAVVT